MVTVRVEHNYVVSRGTDVLVLEYVQSVRSSKSDLLRHLGLQDARPSVGRNVMRRMPEWVGPNAVALIGVEPAGFDGARAFGYQILSRTRGLDAREVCITVQRAGNWPEDAERFRSQLIGIFIAIDRGVHDPTLEYVTIIDSDPYRAAHLQAILADVLYVRELLVEANDDLDDPGAAPRDDEGPASTTGKHSREVGPGTRHSFVAMPFDDEFADYFYYGIRPALAACDLYCTRMDEQPFTGAIVAKMEELIRDAHLVVADLSTANPNVYLEVGYAWAARRPTVLLCDVRSEPLFDVRGHRFLRYTSIRDLEQKLRTEVTGLGLGR